jgi:hypothetical protein
MVGTSPRLLKLILLVIVLLTALACPAFAEDVQTLIEKAEGGDPEAQFYLGRRYYKERGVPQDNVEGAKWSRKAAEQGHADAQLALGLRGLGVPQDYPEAVKWLRKAAEQGRTFAQYNLGIMYDKGQGVPQDSVEAMKWYRKAAEQGDADAQYNPGIAYGKEQGVPQDHAEEMKWFKKVAEQAIVESQYNLGVAYYKGKGVSQDYVQSYFWLSLAASRSYGEYFKKYSDARDLVASMLTPEQRLKTQQMTREWEAKHPGK